MTQLEIYAALREREEKKETAKRVVTGIAVTIFAALWVIYSIALYAHIAAAI